MQSCFVCEYLPRIVQRKKTIREILEEKSVVMYVAHEQIKYEIFICGEGGTSDPNLEAR